VELFFCGWKSWGKKKRERRADEGAQIKKPDSIESGFDVIIIAN